jgi:hypothetical protein
MALDEDRHVPAVIEPADLSQCPQAQPGDRDLAGSNAITQMHRAEVLQYRP